MATKEKSGKIHRLRKAPEWGVADSSAFRMSGHFLVSCLEVVRTRGLIA